MRKKRIVSTVLGLGAVLLAGYAGYLYIHPEQSGRERQNTEESLAQAYIEALLEKETENEGSLVSESTFEETSEETEELSLEEESTEVRSSDAEEPTLETKWADPNYYTRDGITYTPDYAQGELLGVLEVDRAGIRRGVYGGSWEAIEHDLDIWMVTEARPDYELGNTHFAIYGHNHTVQDLSFNRLKDVTEGDVFTYTTDQGVYIYDVTRFFADWREMVTKNIVDNFTLPADKCYIISCGRNEYRYKDIVVEGTLRCIVDLKTYAKDPSYYKYEYDGEEVSTEADTLEETSDVAEKQTEENSKEESTSMEETSETAKIKTQIEVSCTANGIVSAVCVDETGNKAPCELALFNADGLIMEKWTQPQSMPQTELTSDAEYVVGVLTMDSEYETPEEYVFKYHGGQIDRQKLNQKEALDENGAPSWAKPLFFGMAGVFLLLLAILLFSKK